MTESGEKYITKQTNYKIEYGDILCISDSLLKKEKQRHKKQYGPQFNKSKTYQMAKKFEEMLEFENENVLVINKPCGVPSQMGSGLDP